MKPLRGWTQGIAWVLGLALAVAMGSCASAEKIHSLRSGMLSSEVSDEVGNPETIRRQGEQVVWFYRTDEGRCAVVFESERLSSWACAGEDAASNGLRGGSQTASSALAVSAASSPPPVFIH